MKSKVLVLLFLLAPALPAFADYGCHFMMDSVLSVELNDPTKKVSFRFTAREDMDLLGVSFYCGAAKNVPSYKVSLQEDRSGTPTGPLLGSNSIVPRSNSWATLPFSNIPLTRDRVYHLVIEADLLRGGHHPVGILDAQHCASVVLGDRLNPFDPRDEKADPKLNVLSFADGKWKVLDRQPLFALQAAGDKAQGVPYDSFGAIPIHGNGTPRDGDDDVLQSECLHPHYGFTATGVSVRLRKQGNPTAPLKYRVYAHQYEQHKTVLAFSGQAFLPQEVGKTFQWVTFKFKKEDNPQTFPPECRYIVFQTDAGRASAEGPGCEDCYVISDIGHSGGLAFGSELTFDGGAHLSREAVSTDGGRTWIDLFERDANVVLTGPAGFSPSLPGPKAIPTPDLLIHWTRP